MNKGDVKIVSSSFFLNKEEMVKENEEPSPKPFVLVGEGVTGVMLVDNLKPNNIIKCYNYRLFFDYDDVKVLTNAERKYVYDRCQQKVNGKEEKLIIPCGLGDDDLDLVDLYITSFIRELRILKALKGKKNIVQLIDGGDPIVNKDMVGFEMERMEMDLYCWIVKQRFFMFTQYQCPEDLALYLSGQLINGLTEIHRIGYAHLDLKPANVLINPSTSELKITDFGNSLRGIPDNFDQITENYRPPEMFEKKPYERFLNLQLADVWSAGCVIYELTYGKMLFPSKATGIFVYNPEFVRIKINEMATGVPPTIAHLAKDMVVDLDKRKCAAELLEVFNNKLRPGMLFYT